MEDHLNYVLANYSISVSKDLDEGIAYFSQLIHESRQSPNVQTQYCKELSKVYDVNCVLREKIMHIIQIIAFFRI